MLGYKLCVNHVVLFLMLFGIPKKMIFKINKILCVNLASFSIFIFLANTQWNCLKGNSNEKKTGPRGALSNLSDCR